MSDNSRIAKNTLVLYLRLIVSIIINLYTVRLLWQVLGIDNYGIYNVVGGIVLMFAFLNNAMIASSQRFISFALGKNDHYGLKKTFSLSLKIHFILALIVLGFAETVGLWFLNYKLNIPYGRLIAANWVYQCSILTFLFTIISVPYNACIVAHEHINIYGYLGILEVFLKLGIVFLVSIIPFDVLISYSVLILSLAVLMRCIYIIYCKRHFEECRYIRYKDSSLMKQMFAFAGWSFIGNMGFSVRDQGMNILINMFFNVAVNAAKGVANQVGAVIFGFASNFTMALNPQITKRYAAGNISDMVSLLMKGCKYALFLMSIIEIPIIVSADSLLKLWLGDVAEYSVGFLQLILILSLIESIISPIVTALQATGRIKKFQIIISVIMLLNLPLAWLWLKLNANPYVVMYVSLGTSIIGLIARLMLLHELIPYSYIEFISTVFLRTIPFIFIMGGMSMIIYPLFNKDLIGMIGFNTVIWIISIILGIVMILNNKEKHMVFNTIKAKMFPR